MFFSFDPFKLCSIWNSLPKIPWRNIRFIHFDNLFSLEIKVREYGNVSKENNNLDVKASTA